MNEWGFLIDENLERQTAAYLETEGIRGEHVSSVLPGADDFDDILPYARRENLMVVTNNIHFKPLSDDEHEGIVIVYNQRLPTWSTANALFRLVDQYRDRNELRRKEVLDPYVE
ncbi:hypothetical protein BRC86_11975 [Halobacteriales archaeon QS_3_64_16]|nr:MAG: hypothetical protein BRC86_11975 [Halobacteriales archaeon QS_3_64_16]